MFHSAGNTRTYPPLVLLVDYLLRMCISQWSVYLAESFAVFGLLRVLGLVARLGSSQLKYTQRGSQHKHDNGDQRTSHEYTSKTIHPVGITHSTQHT